MLDPVFDEAERHPEDEGLRAFCDPLVRGIHLQPHPRIRQPGLRQHRPDRPVAVEAAAAAGGRRGVYLAELKVRGDAGPDRALHPVPEMGHPRAPGRRQAAAAGDPGERGIHRLRAGPPPRRPAARACTCPRALSLRRTRERYSGRNQELAGQLLPVIYFERDYLHGLVTDKLPLSKYLKAAYALRLAQLLGRPRPPTSSAAGRWRSRAGHLRRRRRGDHGGPGHRPAGRAARLGSQRSLHRLPARLAAAAADYARPVNARADKLPDPRAFAEAYLRSFQEEFLRIQRDYRRRRRPFDTLFKHLPYDPAGSFAYRWECVLRRLDQTDAEALTAAIRAKIGVLA